MIDELSVGKTATFFAVENRITDQAIVRLFSDLRQVQGVTGHNIFRHVREESEHSIWSAICFNYDASPRFLAANTIVRERLCGYMLIVEHRKHVAIFASRFGIPTAFRSEHLSRVAVAKVEAAIARTGAIFQKLRLRNMSVSPHAMRSKTLEASDLSGVVGPSGSRRYAPQGYAVLHAGVHTSATPSTGRIATRSDRVGHKSLIEFAEQVINGFSRAGDTSPFIRSFARPVDVAAALAASRPVSLGVDIASMEDAFTDDAAQLRLVRSGDQITALTADEVTQLFDELKQPFEIRGNKKKDRTAYYPTTQRKAATIKLNKDRIALRSLDIPSAAGVVVESSALPLGTDENRLKLSQYLDQNDALIVLFEDVSLAYINGNMFRDETLRDGGANFMRYLHPEARLRNVTSEKGNFVAGQVAFEPTSTFGVIVDAVAVNDTTLVCDDLHTEWCDFIGIRNDNGLTQISFYHAKHGDVGLGAGQFHVAVSQAIKNLGNMAFPADQIDEKIAFWSRPYVNNRIQTAISRTIRPAGANIEPTISQSRNAPDLVRRAIVVTSSLSKKDVADVFADLSNGARPKPSFVQLYWLLQSFFSACTEVGAIGSVICRP